MKVIDNIGAFIILPAIIIGISVGITLLEWRFLSFADPWERWVSIGLSWILVGAFAWRMLKGCDDKPLEPK